jgi:LmbE family N-acetylglucosaminyl deacetylase
VSGGNGAAAAAPAAPSRKLMLVLAHPDDESWGNGATIARHVAAGVEVHLVCVSRGGAGWGGLPSGRRREELPEIRAHELKRATEILGLVSVTLWDYPDGGLAGCDRAQLTRRIRAEIERLAPALAAVRTATKASIEAAVRAQSERHPRSARDCRSRGRA